MNKHVLELNWVVFKLVHVGFFKATHQKDAPVLSAAGNSSDLFGIK